MNMLFICNQGENRSRTAAELFEAEQKTQYGGIYSNITREQIEWADIVFVMETRQRTRISELFPKQYLQKRIISLEIPDVYHHDQPELIELLKARIHSILKQDINAPHQQ